MKDAQKIIRDFNAKYNLGGSVETRFIDLSSEVGELGKEILKGTNYGEKKFEKTSNLEFEIGDVLFSLVSVANCAGVDLDIALAKVLKKYEDRFDVKRHIGSES
ncbi:MAG: MazG-like family protein [Candidatus Saccharibacteria bacterium]|nr:MazG-like family protein [Candidatus Saccharibacteria bacterium]